VKLKYLDQWTVARQRNAKNYSELLSDALVPLSNQRFAPVTIPRVKTDRHIFNQYVIRTSRRDQLQDWLKQKKIETEIYYRFLCIFKSVFPTWAMRLARFPRANALRTKPWHFQFTRNSQRTESIMLWDLFGTLSQQIPSHSGPEAPSANGDS
jgi:dTDP-4-amino-4,6-dideoxygalactose transaminase